MRRPWFYRETTVYRAVHDGCAKGGRNLPCFRFALRKAPHLTSWKETLQFGWEERICIITGDELNCYDDISAAIEFEEAYPRLFDNTMMDYTKNGLGGILNDNALLSSSMAYREFSLL